MTEEQFVQFKEIRRLLVEAYDDWRVRADDHHCKSSEGWVQVSYPTYFSVRDDGVDLHKASGIMVYSYVFGPNRSHDFSDFGEALNAVRKWHAEALAETYAE